MFPLHSDEVRKNQMINLRNKTEEMKDKMSKEKEEIVIMINQINPLH